MATSGAGIALPLRSGVGWEPVVVGVRRAVRWVVAGGVVGRSRVMSSYREGDVEASVLRAARCGDRHAFELIVEHYQERLQVLAFHLLGDREQMNDALQDTFVGAYRALPGFRGDAALATWLHRICYRVCLGYLRERRSDVDGDDVLAAVPAPGEAAEDLALQDALAVALHALPAEQRVVVLLVDRDGHDYASVASVLDVPVGTVASRLSAGRAALRRALAAERGGRSDAHGRDGEVT